MKENTQFQTVDETAAALGICRNAAYGAVQRGEIPSVRIGRRLLIPRAWIERVAACISARDGQAG